MENICEYCNKQFTSKSNLRNHINNAKYCIKKREDANNKNNICNYCNKQLWSKYSFECHLNTCKKKLSHNVKESYEKTINELKEQISEQEKKYENIIKDLQNQIERLAITAINRPTNQRINNFINNLIPITEQHLKDQAEFLTLEHIKNGVNGYVEYALNYPLKDKIICTDFSRRKIKYKDEDGNIIDDPEMFKISKKLFKAIEEKNSNLINEYIKELHYKFNILISDPNNEMNEEETMNYDTKFSLLTDELFKVKNQKKDIIEIVNGNKNEIYHEFVKDVCSKTVK